ncbi:YqeG family HAD IIIA-type phosphatase [Synechococcus sp. A15-127]|jgi:HAD superfamily phosphatase (TIGR01668 family)|uniref:YqeG family HAD IIIA-type phosphatase n=1 Tax=Synechococcus sp. A15-127 TaxID=1050624 RepID=UPI001646A34B|nr:YqeG family HAD IIIA-type phosphatase [Synechococcus sp. A15-127]
MAGVSPSHWLLPDWDPGLTIAHLPLPHLTGRDIQAAVIDVDRTLLPGRAVRLPDSVRVWLEDAGRRLQLHLFSNNPSKARISAVASQLDLSFTCGAGKPRRGALRRVIADLDLPPQSIAMVGDRLFTDVLCGNRLGLYTVLVRPIREDGAPCDRDRVQRLERRLARVLGAPAA